MGLDQLKKHINVLRVLAEPEPRIRKAILKSCNNDLIKVLSDCAHNIARGNVKLTPKQRTQLRPHIRNVRSLSNKAVKLGTKRNILVNQSGGLPIALLAPVLAVVLSLLTDTITRH
jgi:hypothetical protein